MNLTIELLGRPRLVRTTGEAYQFRSRKSWAVLAYLILTERPPSRSQLAALLFAEADDPVRALRWSLSEIRRGLGADGSVDGDPVVLTLSPTTVVDVHAITRGSWPVAVQLPGIGADLLDGFTVRSAAAFETWLLAQQRHLAAASEAMLHEAAVGSMSRGELTTALAYAVRAAAMSPLEENHQALVIRLYRLTGNNAAAERQFAAYAQTCRVELGTEPGPAVLAALRETRYAPDTVANDSTIRAALESGTAAVAAGAVGAGVESLRTAAKMADTADSTQLRIRTRLVLAEALIHSVRGHDEEGVSALHEADGIAERTAMPVLSAEARAELGYVEFLRANYNRAEVWLTDALRLAAGSPSITAKATTYLGSSHSDRGNYDLASALLTDAIALAELSDAPRRRAYATTMLGRVNLLRWDLDTAADQLDAAVALVRREHWLAFLPWPAALRAEVQLARGDVAGAAEMFEDAFARACQIGDPCWEGISARGMAMVAEAEGNTATAFEVLADALVRANRRSDPYVWLDCYIRDAQCDLGLRHGHPETERWIDAMQLLASRTGMRDLTVRSLLHGAALGRPGDAAAAALLAADLENPDLQARVAAAS